MDSLIESSRKVSQENLFSTYRVRKATGSTSELSYPSTDLSECKDFFPRFSPKFFINTKIVTMPSQHWAFKCNHSRSCEVFNVNPDDAMNNHYRARLYKYMPELFSDDDANTTTDTTLWKYTKFLRQFFRQLDNSQTIVLSLFQFFMHSTNCCISEQEVSSHCHRLSHSLLINI